MGSDLRLTAWTADDVAAVAAFDAVFREFDRLEDLMSVWREGSDILRLNAAAGDHPVSVSADVREALTIAHQVSDWTDTRAADENPRKGKRLTSGTLSIQGHDPTTNLSFRKLMATELPAR